MTSLTFRNQSIDLHSKNKKPLSITKCNKNLSKKKKSTELMKPTLANYLLQNYVAKRMKSERTEISKSGTLYMENET